MPNASLVLKPGKDKPVRNYHHWIFSGAVASLPDSVSDGEIVSVTSSTGDLVGAAYVNRASSIVGRMVAFGRQDPLQAIESRIIEAITLRKRLFDTMQTTAFRLINAEGDKLPGLIVDQYGEYLVVQIATLGMERLKPLVIDILSRELRPKGIYEKSSLPARREEGLREYEGLVAGSVPDHVEVREHGQRIVVDIIGGQKTGFFIDQREMRHLVREYSAGKRVLNCFSYTGGFSLGALSGGALQATSVDISDDAIALAHENAAQNGYADKHRGIAADVFAYLREAKLGEFDFIILDPPAFVKRKNDVVAGCRGYKDINRLAFKLLPPASLLLTSSCSHFVDEKLFQQVVFQAAREADREVRILSRHRQAPDHPVNLYHPEGEYLKSLLLFVT